MVDFCPTRFSIEADWVMHPISIQIPECTQES
jgi:hypothetical protein